ncbi:MAG: hypothetical protein AB1611_02015 [bacterium]
MKKFLNFYPGKSIWVLGLVVTGVILAVSMAYVRGAEADPVCKAHALAKNSPIVIYIDNCKEFTLTPEVVDRNSHCSAHENSGHCGPVRLYVKLKDEDHGLTFDCSDIGKTFDVTLMAICGSSPDTSSDVAKASITILQHPDAIELDTFTATPQNNQITISWSTGCELDNAGFNILRSESEDGEYIMINPAIIRAQGGAVSREYSFNDVTAVAGVIYYYKLEDIDTRGVSTVHGPVSASIPALWPIYSIDWYRGYSAPQLWPYWYYSQLWPYWYW